MSAVSPKAGSRDALKNSANKDRKVNNLLDVLGDSVKSEEVVEGMQEEEHEHEEGEAHEHEEEADEHVWLSEERRSTGRCDFQCLAGAGR